MVKADIPETSRDSSPEKVSICFFVLFFVTTILLSSPWAGSPAGPAAAPAASLWTPPGSPRQITGKCS